MKPRRTATTRPLLALLVTLLCVAQNLRLAGNGEFFLTQGGLVHFTNVARSVANLTPLVEAADLNAIAQARLKDMFDRQYFSHTSPVTEEGAPEVAKRIGYKYLSIAENIARGYFADDQELVRLWMESIGHRQNIMSPGYTEIGVAVGEGTLEGQPVWIGVQIFARPLSACPEPDPQLRARIDSLKAAAAAVQNQAAALLAQIRNPDQRQRAEIPLDGSSVTRYNALIARQNALSNEVNGLVDLHNAQADRFAACVDSPVSQGRQQSELSGVNVRGSLLRSQAEGTCLTTGTLDPRHHVLPEPWIRHTDQALVVSAFRRTRLVRLKPDTTYNCSVSDRGVQCDRLT